MNKNIGLLAACALTLAACGSQQPPAETQTASGDSSAPPSKLDQVPDAGPCDALPAPRQVSTEILDCEGCTITNAQLAIDGDLQTGAALHIPAGAIGNGSLSIRVSSTQALPPRTLPGAFISWRASLTAPFTGQGFDVNTYLGGVLQETVDSKHLIARNGSGQEYGGGEASKPFDSIEFKLLMPTVTAAEVSILDFCGDGG